MDQKSLKSLTVLFGKYSIENSFHYQLQLSAKLNSRPPFSKTILCSKEIVGRMPLTGVARNWHEMAYLFVLVMHWGGVNYINFLWALPAKAGRSTTPIPRKCDRHTFCGISVFALTHVSKLKIISQLVFQYFLNHIVGQNGYSF